MMGKSMLDEEGDSFELEKENRNQQMVTME